VKAKLSVVVLAVLGFVPAEDRVSFSAMTGPSLFYLGETDLAHKVLSIAEEEGASRASYALKLLQSEGELSIASTGKDTTSGRLVTHTYRVAGPLDRAARGGYPEAVYPGGCQMACVTESSSGITVSDGEWWDGDPDDHDRPGPGCGGWRA
jgi:hypothetical protein